MRKQIQYIQILSLGLLLSSCGVEDNSDESKNDQKIENATRYSENITYEITFRSLWNANEHQAFPSNAHFSPIAVLSHNENFQLFGIGENASEAFEELAETGSLSQTNSLAESAKSNGTVFQYETSSSLFPKPGADSLKVTIKASKEYAMISLASMIAPSPDWIVGVDSLDLIEDGAFIMEKTISLYALNAGTEEGDQIGNFSINNVETNPQEAISKLSEQPGFTSPFAEITIKRK